MKCFCPSTDMHESRLLGYRSNVERFWETTKSYDYKDPFQILAAGTHVITQGLGLDPLIKDAGRTLDNNRSDLAPYTGIAPRTISNIRETIGDLFRLKPFSAVTKVINIPMDAVADGADAVAGKFN